MKIVKAGFSPHILEHQLEHLGLIRHSKLISSNKISIIVKIMILDLGLGMPLLSQAARM